MTAVRALIATGIAIFWIALFVPPMFTAPASAITGVHFVDDGTLFPPNRVRVDSRSPAYRAGLRTGDVLGCLSLRDYTLLGFVGTSVEAYAGTPISTCVRRNGTLHHVTFIASEGPPVPNVYGSTAAAVVRVFVVLVFFLTAIALVVLRPGLSTWLFYCYAIGNAPSYATQTNATVDAPWLYAIVNSLPNFGNFSAVAFLLLFAIVVPDDRIPRGWRRNAFLIAAPAMLAFCCFTAWFITQTRYGTSASLGNQLDEVLTGITIAIVAARLLTMERSERARFGWAAFAIVAGVVANDLRNVLAVVDPSLRLASTIAGDLTIVMPLALLYAILRRHVIDVRFALSRTVVYALLTTLVIGVIGAVDWATSAYLHSARVAMALDAIVTIGVAFALNRLHRWMESFVDFLLFRKKYQAETFLTRLGHTLLSAAQEQTIDRALVRDPQERLDLTFAALFRNTGSAFVLNAASGAELASTPGFDYEHDLVRFLITERTRLPLGDLTHHTFGHSSIALPIFEGRDLTGFAVYGVHRDGTKLDPDEVESLERLCEAAAQAYTYIEVSRYRQERKLTPVTLGAP